MEITEIQRTLSKRRQNNPLKYFWPHQKNCSGVQRADGSWPCDESVITFTTYDGRKHLIRGCPQFKFLNNKCDTRAYFGANRAGKTTAGAVEVGYHTTGQYPDWWSGRRWDRPTVGRVFAADFSKGVKVVTNKFKEWFPQDCIEKIEKNNLKAEVGWYIKHVSPYGKVGVSFFDIMTYEQDVSLAEGWNGDWVLFDEPPPRDLYIATARGLIDNDGICIFTLTPLKEPWLFDEIYNSKDNKVFSVVADLRHNLERFNPLSKETIGLKEESIRKFESKLTEEERETRMHGKFRYLAGRIWKEWERDIHTFPRKMWVKGKDMVAVDGEPPKHWPRMMLVDPHDRNPHAILWVACDDTDNYWAYREMWIANTTIGDIVKAIKQVEMNSRETIQSRIMDPNFGPKRYGNSGLTVRDEFEQAARKIGYSLRFNFADDHKELGRKAFAEMLKYDTMKPLSLLNHPRIKFADDMKESIYQIEHYIWDEYRSGIERDPKEKPKDINTHFPDLCQYFALCNFGWRKPKILDGVGAYYV